MANPRQVDMPLSRPDLHGGSLDYLVGCNLSPGVVAQKTAGAKGRGARVIGHFALELSSARGTSKAFRNREYWSVKGAGRPRTRGQENFESFGS